VRLLGALLVLAIVLFAAPRVADPHTWILAQAVHDLGPISGWRCAAAGTYVYEPDHERADSTLLADAPEASVLAQVPWLEIDRVEANLRGGETLVTTHGPDDQRVYVLSPGRLQSITAGDTTVCNAHLSDWQIVGEEDLG
jgi:hypothetical protein